MDFFTLNDENGKQIVKFDFLSPDKVNIPNWDNWKSVPISTDTVTNFISSAIGAGSNVGLAKLATNGLFKATADPSTLMKLSSGGIGSTVMKNGKMISQAGFIPAGNSIITPLIGFQLLSIVTGQYYMNNISKQLNSVLGKLDQILSYLDSRDKAILEFSAQRLEYFTKKENFTLEDFIELRNIRSDVAKIKNTYIIECNKFNINNNEYSSGSYLTNYGRAEHIVNKFHEKGYLNKIDILIFSENLLHFTKEVELFMNIKYCSKNNDINRIESLKENINILMQEPDKGTRELLKVTENITKSMQSKVKSLHNDADVYLDSFQNLSNNLKLNFNSITIKISSSSVAINNSSKNMILPLNNEREIIIDTRDSSPKLYIK